jgi:hypothetical protein
VGNQTSSHARQHPTVLEQVPYSRGRVDDHHHFPNHTPQREEAGALGQFAVFLELLVRRFAGIAGWAGSRVAGDLQELGDDFALFVCLYIVFVLKCAKSFHPSIRAFTGIPGVLAGSWDAGWIDGPALFPNHGWDSPARLSYIENDLYGTGIAGCDLMLAGLEICRHWSFWQNVRVLYIENVSRTRSHFIQVYVYLWRIFQS